MAARFERPYQRKDSSARKNVSSAQDCDSSPVTHTTQFMIADTICESVDRNETPTGRVFACATIGWKRKDIEPTPFRVPRFDFHGRRIRVERKAAVVDGCQFGSPQTG